LNSNDHPLIQQLVDWSADISREFERSRIKGGKSPSDIADQRENIVGEFLQNFFPYPFSITKGVIRDFDGKESASVDRVILSPNHPKTFNDKGLASLILADGVRAAIEIKSSPMSNDEIEAFVAQSKKTKKLRRKEHSLLLTGLSGLKKQLGDKYPEFEDYHKEIPYFVFFLEKPANTDTCVRKILDRLESENRREMPDFVVINGVGIIVNEKFAGRIGYPQEGYYFEEWNERSAGGFIFYLNTVPKNDLEMSESIMSLYLRPIQLGVKRCGYLNGKFIDVPNSV